MGSSVVTPDVDSLEQTDQILQKLKVDLKENTCDQKLCQNIPKASFISLAACAGFFALVFASSSSA